MESLAMRTTPNALQLQELLARGCEQGAKAAVLEVSSHALDQCRAEDLEFDVVAFTNLTRDHLDYHGDMERYFLAKRHLFTLAERSPKSPVTAVVCIDDPYGQRLADEISSNGRLELLTIGFASQAALRADSYELKGGATTLHFSSPEGEGCVTYPFIGAHNALNMLVALGCLHGLGISQDRWDSATRTIPPISGRLELVHGDGPLVFVDYAHTPDALEKALRAAREVTKGTLWVVFGCGGDRDPGKRPIMATVASAFADRVVLTSDNPRTEDPAKIIQEALDCPAGAAIRAHGVVEVDRAKAILEALRRAESQDVVVIAGKGHEDYQILGTDKVHFSDQEQVISFFTSSLATGSRTLAAKLNALAEGEAA
jgi:UDP-N-acetylmuramoyl-L-alanyl-D-glutamate--2,6-diaminopimelate ligase